MRRGAVAGVATKIGGSKGDRDVRNVEEWAASAWNDQVRRRSSECQLEWLSTLQRRLYMTLPSGATSNSQRSGVDDTWLSNKTHHLLGAQMSTSRFTDVRC